MVVKSQAETIVNSQPEYTGSLFHPLNAELNPICHLLALLGAHPTLHVSRIRVKLAFTRRLDFKLVQFALRRISSVSTNF